MSARIEFRVSNPEIGLLTRTPRPGPELDMIEHETPGLIGLFACRDLELALFWEPKVDVGFPDLVLAIFSPETYTHWSSVRNNLTTTDLKIVHELGNSRGMSIGCLEERLGYSRRQLARSIDKLNESGMVHRKNTHWYLRSLSRIFGIHRLIAIEAKLSNWRDAFVQAKTNTWFASESYVLSPIKRPKATTRDRSTMYQVGILATGRGTPQKLVSVTPTRLPASYASWQFNEWIGRALNR